MKFDITSSPSTNITWCFSCTRSNNADQVYYWLKKIWNNRLSPYKTCWEYLGVAISHLAIFLKIKSFCFCHFCFWRMNRPVQGKDVEGFGRLRIGTTPNCPVQTRTASIQPRTASVQPQTPYNPDCSVVHSLEGVVFFCQPPFVTPSPLQAVDSYKFAEICKDTQRWWSLEIPRDPLRNP